MSENFRKIKKKYLTVAIIAGCILGACLGVALTCTLAVILKTTGVNVHWAVYIPVALVLSAGSGYLFFLILRPNDSRIAKKLDRDYALNQKVQTMVEFAQVEGDLPALQREQTDEALGEVAKKRVDLKWLAKFAFVPVLAAAMLFAGIFVPAKKSSYVDPSYSITNTHRTALKNLIEDVEGSSLEAGLKSLTVLELNVLMDMLQEAEYESAMKSSVITAARNIDNLVANANSYLKISTALGESEVLKDFSTAVVNGVVDYKNSATLTYMNAVKEKEKTVDEDVAYLLTSWENAFLEELAQSVDEAVKLLEFSDALSAGLEKEELVKEFAPINDGDEQPAVRALRTAQGDAYYNLLVKLGGDLSDHAYAVLNGTSSFAAKGYIDNFIASSKAELGKQSYNCMMDEFIRNTLSRIFGISRAELGSNLHVAPNPTQNSEGGNKKPDSSGEGGYGGGLHPYGSNDEILDVDSPTGEKKKYGDFIDPDRPDNGTYYDKYYNRAMEYIQSGSCPAEVAAYIRQYFAYLNNGMED